MQQQQQQQLQQQQLQQQQLQQQQQQQLQGQWLERGYGRKADVEGASSIANTTLQSQTTVGSDFDARAVKGHSANATPTTVPGQQQFSVPVMNRYTGSNLGHSSSTSSRPVSISAHTGTSSSSSSSTTRPMPNTVSASTGHNLATSSTSAPLRQKAGHHGNSSNNNSESCNDSTSTPPASNAKPVINRRPK
jgi:transcription initiation factor TFIID subunit TAF12